MENDIKYLNLRGAKLPALGFGTWQLDDKACVKAVETALEIGYRHIDTAQIYENEEEVGQAVENSRVKRAELFITTKIWTTNYAAKLVASSVEESLDKLKTDYVDLLLMHWPNPQMKLGETLDAMQKLMADGKTKAIGVSNFPVALMREAVEVCKAPIACNQVEYHAMLSQKPVLDYALAHNIVVTAYSPLARAELVNNPVLAEIGKKYNKTASQVALRWIIEQDAAAIPKAASEKNARANFEIFDFELSDDDRKQIAGLNRNRRVVNPGFAPTWDVTN